MLTFLAKLKDSRERHNRFVHLRDQIAAMSEAEALDIGIHPLNAREIAYNTVYGRS